MFYPRLFGGLSFLGFALASGATLRLAVVERAWPTTAGNADYFEDLAQRQPTLAGAALRAAVRLNPRDSAAWMALGLAAERDGDMQQAADCFLEAEKVDRQYLPAWTSANFFFRRGNDLQFWRAATRAARLSYDDPSPLIELADHRQSNAIAALERLGDSAHLERGYLRFLIVQGRWREAEEVAARLSLRDASIKDASDRDASDGELLLNFTGRLIEANEAERALAVWNRLQPFPAPGRAGRDTLLNENFEKQPSGQGFDWQATEPAGGSVHWEPSKLEFWLTESTPDACILLKQWVVLDAGRVRLRFKYRTEGLAEATGLRWILLHGGQVEASSAVLAQAPRGAANGNAAEWNFRATKAGLYQLAWIYSRVPGTTHQEGRAEMNYAGLEAP